METQEREKLKGMALLRYMIENKKKMEEEAVEEYKNSKEMQAVVRELRASNQRKKSFRQ
ncbi:MAG: hypothetical protein RLZZ306_2514 [Bacteroidota bacterium]|jgi:hypothetical protein